MADTVLLGSVAAEVNSALRRDQFAAGRSFEDCVLYEAAGALTIDSVLLFARIPVDCVLLDLIFASDDLGTTGLFDIGFYPGNIAPASIVKADAVNDDAIATLIDVKAAAVAATSVRFEAANIDSIAKPAYKLAGLSDRPAYNTFYLAITVAEATTAAGTIAIRYRHTAP